MKNKKLIAIFISSLVLLPVFVQAAASGSSGSNPFMNTGGVSTLSSDSKASTAAMSSYRASCQVPVNIEGLFKIALCILDGFVVPFLIGLGLVIFLVGVVNYVRSGDNEEKRTAGRDLMWFGIVALFVMIGVWGFVNLLFNTFFGKDTQFSSLPKQSTSVFQP